MREQRPLPWRALSIKQPWAWLIVNGHKDVENRDWPTRMRGPIFIHAGKSYDRACLVERFGRLVPTPQWVEWLTGRGLGGVLTELPTSFDLGGIVGLAEITDCVTQSTSPWFVGEYGFVVKRARPLPFVALKGQLMFFQVPDQVTDLLGLSRKVEV